MNEICPACKGIQRFISIEKHVESGDCALNLFIAKCEPLDYVPICIFHFLGNERQIPNEKNTRQTWDFIGNAVRELNIPHKTCEVEGAGFYAYHLWGPQWLCTAVETFQKMQGYAGMTLAEYLQRLL